jgi:hypothetical protein
LKIDHMSWLQINNPEIDARKLEAEIEAEVDRLKKEKNLVDSGAGRENSPPAFPPAGGGEYFMDNLEKYAGGVEEITRFRRTFLLGPILKIFLKFLRRALRGQYIFNSLAIEILRNQEKRIQELEDRRAHHK